MPHIQCTDTDDSLRCSATVGNLEERGEPDRQPYLGKATEISCTPYGQCKAHREGLHFKHESELLYTCSHVVTKGLEPRPAVSKARVNQLQLVQSHYG